MKKNQISESGRPLLPPVRYPLRIQQICHALISKGQSQYSHSFTSATDALFTALEALSSRDGGTRREVIVPDFICPNVISAVTSTGLQPVTVAIDNRNWFYTSEALSSALGPNTLAVIIVSYFGMAPVVTHSINELEDVAIIADWAQSYGSPPKLPSVVRTECTVYSFGAGKSLPAGGGGVIVPGNPEYEKLLQQSNNSREATFMESTVHLLKLLFSGLIVSPLVWPLMSRFFAQQQEQESPAISASKGHLLPGFVLRYIESNAKQLDEEISQRRQNAKQLISILGGLNGITVPNPDCVDTGSCVRVPVVFNKASIMQECRDALLKNGILCGGAKDWHKYDQLEKSEESRGRRLLTLPAYSGSEIYFNRIEQILRSILQA